MITTDQVAESPPIKRKPEPAGETPAATPVTPLNGAVAPLVQLVALKEIVRSPWNRTIDLKDPEFDKLVESIRVHGVFQPGMGRPLPGALDAERKPGAPRIELVIGERRWLASEVAGKPTMPIIVRQMTDTEALELQAEENEKRKNLSPIERAEKYQQLLDQYEKAGMNKEAAVAELCKKLSIGKKKEIGKSTVYEVLRLLKLPADVREKVQGGTLPASHAGLLAQLNDAPDLQKRLTQRILAPPTKKADQNEEWDMQRDAGGVLSFRDTKEIVDEQIKLSEKRKKWEAHAIARKAKGEQVLAEDEIKKAINQYGSAIGGYVAADALNREYSKGWPYKSYATLMRRHAPKPVWAHDREFGILKLYPKKEAITAIQKAGHKKRKVRGGGGGYDNTAYLREEKKRKEREEAMAPVVAAAVTLMLKTSQAKGSAFPWTFLVQGLINHGRHDTAQLICQRRGWKGKGVKEVLAQAGRLPANQIPGLLAEILILQLRGWKNYSMRFDPAFLDLAKFYKVDIEKLKKELAEPAKTEVQASGQETKPKTAKKPKGGLTPAARRKLSEAMKARWAARRKAGAK